MKYAIEGFSQQQAVKFRDDKQKLDCIDLVLLRWFIDFKDTPKMKYLDVRENRYYWVNYEKILSDMPILSMSKRAVYDRLQKLVKFGILTHHHVKDGGSFSYYGIGPAYERLVSDNAKDEAHPYEANFRGGMKQTSEGVGSCLPTKDSSISDSSITTPYNPPMGEDGQPQTAAKSKPPKRKKASPKEDYDLEGFNAFYAAYPRHEGKAAALKAWNKLAPDVVLQEQMGKALEVQKQSQQWRKDGGQYIPMPSTWLNGKRWEDEVQTQTQPNIPTDADYVPLFDLGF